MAVIELTSSLKKSFIIFALKFEYKSISFISRIYRNGQVIIPPSKSAKVFCEVSDTSPDYILNTIMITSGGIVMPIFSNTPPSQEVLKNMLQKIINYKNKIFCVLGISKDTENIKKILKVTSFSTNEYSLLKENSSKQYSIEKNLLKIKKARKKDTISLFPLEKAYILEEVLVESSLLNQQAVLLNLKKTCTNQSVFYGSLNKEIIAKVNTNGQGFGYNQIGGVYTKPEYRNQGISTYLMKILLNEIHISGKNAVLYVKKENKPALALYKKLGFDIVNDYSAHYIIE